MALKNVLISGDCHGRVSERLHKIAITMPEYRPEETAVILLGDVGFQYYLNKKDRIQKLEASSYGYTIYCVHGNHEARPRESRGMKLIGDDFVGGAVWMEEEFPLIRYFCDWGFYNIQGRKTLVLGGAYSVDKHYRLANGWQWFEDEQLTAADMRTCMSNMKEFGHKFDLVLSHTCPYRYMPTDLFLNYIDQSTVDNTMELWMDEVISTIPTRIHLWGHFHADRIEAPYCEMFYTEVEDLKIIEERWNRYDKTGELDWWLPMSPSMKKVMNKE
jgi:3-oxoacid CoA-transferase subunit A